MAYIGKYTELVGGILLALGLLTRITALFPVINMGVITFVLCHGKILSDDLYASVSLTVSHYSFSVLTNCFLQLRWSFPVPAAN